MKITVVIFLTLLISFEGVSQEKEPQPVAKGNLIFSGGMSLAGHSGNLYEGYTSLHLTSDALYLLKENIAIGGAMNYLNTDYTRGDRYSEFEIGPSISYFFKNISSSKGVAGSIYPFAQLSILLSTRSIKDDAGNKTSGFGFKIPLSAGCVYMMSRTVGFFCNAFFSLDSDKTEIMDKSLKGSSYGILFGFKIFKYQN